MTERLTPDELFAANLRLAPYFARSFRAALGDDALQVARVALWEACRTHDPARGALSTWAGKHIRYALLSEVKFLRRHFPRHLASLSRTLDDSDTELGELIADPHDAFAGTVETDVQSLLAACSPVEREVFRLRWGIGAQQDSDPVMTGIHGAKRGALRTLAEVAGILGVTRQRVQQIEARAQSRIRGHVPPFTGIVRSSAASRALQIGKPSRGWLWTGEVASVWGVDRRMVTRACVAGRIKAEYVAHRWRISEDEAFRVE